MSDATLGRILSGEEATLRRAFALFSEQPVDMEMPDDGSEPYLSPPTTLREATSVTGPGTFFHKAQRTLRFEPTTAPGWAFRRDDLKDSMPIPVSVNSIWTTQRNIVLCSGSPHNYMRMVEHIVALRLGLGIDNLLIRVDSGDPPLFDRGSLDLVEALERAGTVPVPGARAAAYVTVKEPVTVGGPHGSFLTFLPAEQGSRRLSLDCAIHFPNAIGRQRIRLDVTKKSMRHGALARTNTNLWMMLFTKSIGWFLADMRNLGYTMKNIQIAGRWRYINRPGLMHNGKSLEPAWHRAALDLLAAVALIDRGRFAGRILSYKSGHTLDVQAIRHLYEHDLLCDV